MHLGDPEDTSKDLNPDAALIQDKLNSKESPASLRAFLFDGASDL